MASSSSNHEIFLSHSGQQKGFTKDLDKKLCEHGYKVFFDIKNDSLPIGHPFPQAIFKAIETCNLAIIILSHGFLTSPWPMRELRAFASRVLTAKTSSSTSSSSQPQLSRVPPPLMLLPIFLKLSTQDIKEQKNLVEWQKTWEKFEHNDSNRSNSQDCTCEAAVKLLASMNGVVKKEDKEQGEAGFIEEIVEKVSKVLPPPQIFLNTMAIKDFFNIDRFCNIISEYRKLEANVKNSHKVLVVGMHGVRGSGKSTLSRFLCDYHQHEYPDMRGKVFHIELPISFNSDPKYMHGVDQELLIKQYSKLLCALTWHNSRDIVTKDLGQVRSIMRAANCKSTNKIFLVFDNITNENKGTYESMVDDILSSGIVGQGSRIMMVAQSLEILDSFNTIRLKKHKNRIAITMVEVPRLTSEEPIQIITKGINYLLGHEQASVRIYMTSLLPFVLEQIEVLEIGDKVSLLNTLHNVSGVFRGTKEAVENLLKKNFDFALLGEELRTLFLDIAMFIIPAGYANKDDAIRILSKMHGIEEFHIKAKVNDLKSRCFVSEIGNELRVHELFRIYIQERMPDTSSIYINRKFNLKDRYYQLDCPQARTIAAEFVDEEIHVKMDVGARAANLKALCVRGNSWWSILELKGDLSSLSWCQLKDVRLSPPLQHWAASSQLTSLRELRLAISTNIFEVFRNINEKFRMEDVSRHFPHLEILQVMFPRTSVLVNVGNAPNLRWLQLEGRARGVLQVGACPKLEYVRLEGVSYEVILDQSSMPLMKSFSLYQCRIKMKRLHFTEQSSQFLEELSLVRCRDLEHLSIGPGSMPNLKLFKVSYCSPLRPEEVSGLRYLLHHQRQIVQMMLDITEAYVDLDLQYAASTQEFERQQVLQRLEINMDRLTFVVGGQFRSLKILKLTGLKYLREIEGTQHLPCLKTLRIERLPNLTSVSKTWPVGIEEISFKECPNLDLQRLPPFSGLPWLHAANLSINESFVKEVKIPCTRCDLLVGNMMHRRPKDSSHPHRCHVNEIGRYETPTITNLDGKLSDYCSWYYKYRYDDWYFTKEWFSYEECISSGKVPASTITIIKDLNDSIPNDDSYLPNDGLRMHAPIIDCLI